MLNLVRSTGSRHSSSCDYYGTGSLGQRLPGEQGSSGGPRSKLLCADYPRHLLLDGWPLKETSPRTSSLKWNLSGKREGSPGNNEMKGQTKATLLGGPALFWGQEGGRTAGSLRTWLFAQCQAPAFASHQEL